MNLSPLVNDCELELGALSLQFVDQTIAFGDFLLLRLHDLHHDVLVTALGALSIVTVRGESPLTIRRGETTHLDVIDSALLIVGCKGWIAMTWPLWERLHAVF